MISVLPESTSVAETEFFKIRAIDYVQFYVGNAYQAAHFYRLMAGFSPIAYAGFETGCRDHISYLVKQNDIRLLFTCAVTQNSPIAKHVAKHGDGIKEIAFRVDNVEAAFHETVKRGAQPVLAPTISEDEQGKLIKATISVYGDVTHTFIERDHYQGLFMPQFQAIKNPPSATSTGLLFIDHLALSLAPTQMDVWVDFYQKVFGFHISHSEDILTEYSAMNSKVVQNRAGNVIFAIIEPAPGKRRSQIEEYLEFNEGPGVQHIAFASKDIIKSVRALRANGVDFLSTPGSYYDMLPDRIGHIDEDLLALRELSILVDRDRSGYLMQIFSRSMQSRPTTFIEIIQRNGCKGFGGGNIKALYQAIEVDQARRGNL